MKETKKTAGIKFDSCGIFMIAVVNGCQNDTCMYS